MIAWQVLIAAAGEGEDHVEEHIDQTHSALWPEGYEIWFGGIASVIIFGLLFWKVGPMVKAAMAKRTARIQSELDASASDEADATAEAARIREAKGDIESERARILADADERAEALLNDGRARLEREAAELEAKADADIASARSRGGDELRAEISRLASGTADRILADGLDAETQQRLIEEFIQRVGSSTGAPA